MSVEASAELTTNVISEAPVATPSMEDEMGAIWDRIERDNGAARDQSGKFASTKEEAAPVEVAEEPLEGGEEGAADRVAESSTPAAVEVPLPSNWRGLEDAWEKIPADIRPAVREHAERLHQQAAKLGQEVSAYKPIGEVIQKYKDYFGGSRGNYKPHEGIDYLFNLQRQMDDAPFDTLMQIADTYGLRQELATRFGAGGEAVNPDTQSLLTEIGQLKRMLQETSDPDKISSLIDQKLNEDRVTTQVKEVISRTSKDMPLYAEVEAELPFFISKAWAKLGETASQDAVLKLGYDMAVNADPDLRGKVAAPKVAATNTDPARLAAAKNANQSNLRSTSPGKPRELTDDEALAAAWDKAQRA